jgi:GNAT superfamily N-acetyltransferase
VTSCHSEDELIRVRTRSDVVGHDGGVAEFDRYVESLVGSWERLVVPHPSARVVRGQGFAACRHPNVMLNNAVVLAPPAVVPARRVFDDAASFALWCRADDVETAAAVAAAGLRRDVTTCAMRCELSAVRSPVSPVRVLRDVDVVRIAELNGVPGDVLVDVPAVHGYATERFDAGLVLIEVGSDVNVSFVATRPEVRRRGLAGAVVATALCDARQFGSTTATLQATPMAEGLYLKLGFARVARIQEWVSP